MGEEDPDGHLTLTRVGAGEHQVGQIVQAMSSTSPVMANSNCSDES